MSIEGFYLHHRMGTIASLSKEAIKPNSSLCKNQKKIVFQVTPKRKTSVFSYVSCLKNLTLYASYVVKASVYGHLISLKAPDLRIEVICCSTEEED